MDNADRWAWKVARGDFGAIDYGIEQSIALMIRAMCRAKGEDDASRLSPLWDLYAKDIDSGASMQFAIAEAQSILRSHAADVPTPLEAHP